jgi:hypothetical protein
LLALASLTGPASAQTLPLAPAQGKIDFARGVRGGQVISATDAVGYTAIERPTHPN